MTADGVEVVPAAVQRRSPPEAASYMENLTRYAASGTAAPAEVSRACQLRCGRWRRKQDERTRRKKNKDGDRKERSSTEAKRARKNERKCDMDDRRLP